MQLVLPVTRSVAAMSSVSVIRVDEGAVGRRRRAPDLSGWVVTVQVLATIRTEVSRVAKRRGFFAEMQHQNRLREQRERQQARAHAQATARAVRLSEKARRDWERACASADRAANKASAAAAKERARLHVEVQLAEVEVRNAALAESTRRSMAFWRPHWTRTITSIWTLCGRGSSIRRSIDRI